jgi:hypothetical protein
MIPERLRLHGKRKAKNEEGGNMKIILTEAYFG